MSAGPACLYALVTEAERPVMRSATAMLAAEITRAGSPLALHCVFAESLAEIPTDATAIVVVSLLAEMDRESEPWAAAAGRLRAYFGQATTPAERRVFLCTILRHVDPQAEPERLQGLRIRIRRLNLLTAELSHETGLQVIDLDRALSDIGARPLQTDYRLGGAFAAEAAARCIAQTLLSAGLDEFVPYEAQEAARAAIAALPTPWQDMLPQPHRMAHSNLISLGRGRRRQRVSPVVDSVPGNHAGWLLQGVLSGRISLADAAERLGNAISKRGLRGSVALLLAGLRVMLRQAPRTAPPAP